MENKINHSLEINLKKYNLLTELKNILLSGELESEVFMERTEEFLELYNSYPHNHFAEFYDELNKAYMDKIRERDLKFISAAKLEYLLNNPVNNKDFDWNKLHKK